MRLGLARVNEIWELYGVLDEEDGNVIAHDVPVALFGIEFDGEATDVSNSIGTAAAAQNGGETHEDGRFTGSVGENGRKRHILGTLVQLESPESSSTPGVYDTLGNPLVVKSMNLFICVSLDTRKCFQLS